MDIMTLASKLADLNSWITANSDEKRAAVTSRQERLLRDLTKEFAYNMRLLLPPGEDCPCCDGTGVKSDA